MRLDVLYKDSSWLCLRGDAARTRPLSAVFFPKVINFTVVFEAIKETSALISVHAV